MIGIPSPAPIAWPGLFLASLALAGCASAPPIAERYVPPAIGSTVAYRVTSTGSFGNGTSIVNMTVSEATFEGRVLRKYSNAGGATLQSENAGTVALLGPTGQPLMRYDPPLDFKLPLTVGKTWTTDHALTVGAGTRMAMKTFWNVEAYEAVTVPAGTFQAWRIVMTDNFGYRQTSWSVPETMGMFAKRYSERPQGHPQGAGTQLMEMTMVPAVR